jgi:hypothetical protein
MQEIWKDIPNYEGIYQVSNFGNFKSYERIVFYNNKKAIRKSKILNLRESKAGYLYTVFSVNKERKTIKPHRIVAKVFVDNPLNKPCVNHINGIKTDNRVENLEWVTHSENTKHAFNNGLKKGISGEKSHYSKIKLNDVFDIRNSNLSTKELSEKYKISQSQINRIKNKLNWKLCVAEKKETSKKI